MGSGQRLPRLLSCNLDDYEAQIPNLAMHCYLVTSDVDPDYNCIAWAVGDVHRHWWPTASAREGPAYWPQEATREESVDAFVEAFATLGYVPCDNADLEHGVEKLAIYVSLTTARPTHVARQLPSGRWASKLNVGIDIEHPELDAVGGGRHLSYGEVACVVRRARVGDPPAPTRPWPEGRPKGRPWPTDLHLP